MSDLFTNPHITGALYFTDQGHYIFKQKERNGQSSSVTCKTLREPEVCAAFTRKNTDSGWMQSGIVRIGISSLGPWYVYFSEPCCVRIHILDQREFLIPLPALLMIASPKEYSLYALNIEMWSQFKPKGNIYAAPFPNVRTGGSICWGKNEQPKYSPDHANDVWKAFFESPFNADLTNGKSNKYPDDVRQMLSELDLKEMYPVDDLVKIGTVEEAVNKVIGEER